MVLDRIDDSTNEYVIHNTSFAEGGAVLRIAKNNAYYTCDPRMMILNAAGEFKINGQNGEEWSLVNEFVARKKLKDSDPLFEDDIQHKNHQLQIFPLTEI